MKVLLIEDNPAHAELVKRSFEEHEVRNELYHQPDGAAALDFLFRRGVYSDPERSPRPDVILLDLKLPKINGLDVLKEIKSSPDLKRIPVVVLTTSNAQYDLETAYDRYANSYLVKPADFPNFSELMEILGYYWLEYNSH